MDFRNDVVIDDREKPWVLEKGYEYFPHLSVERLEVGDLVCGDVCIERKEIHDFASSIIDGRLKKQAKRMLERFKAPFIFVVGDWEPLKEQEHFEWFTEQHYTGAVASTAAGIGVPVISCKDEDIFWLMATKFFERYDPSRPIVIKEIIRPKGDDTYVSMLCCVEGIGESKAKLILKNHHFLTLPNVTKEELMKIPGIGDKYATSIRKYFDTTNIKNGR